jgi:rod shape-determining protein MreC
VKRHFARRRWRIARPEATSAPAVLLALVLACAVLITLDHGSAAPFAPVRRTLGEAFGPAQRVTMGALRPIRAVPDWFTSQQTLRHDVARLESENADLRGELETVDYDRLRLDEFDRLTQAADTAGRALVPARVIGMGPMQSFSRTVIIDAGSRAGLRPDLTVVNADGLVGRVIGVTRTTATVLLIIDPDSVVGARVGQDLEVGFLTGHGVIDERGALDLELVDGALVPHRDDVIVTWGGSSSSPYVSGIPIGRVTKVFASVRQSSQRAVIVPFADFSSLDLVGVVVASGTRSDRAVIEADGSLR